MSFRLQWIQVFARTIDCTVIMETKSRSLGYKHIYIYIYIWSMTDDGRTTQTHNHSKIWKKAMLILRLDYENKMGYKYIHLITWTWRWQLNTYHCIYCKDKYVTGRARRGLFWRVIVLHVILWREKVEWVICNKVIYVHMLHHVITCLHNFINIDRWLDQD